MSVQPWGEPGSGYPPGKRPTAGWQPAPVPVAMPQAVMRAGHADRDRTLDVLKAAFAEGRLSVQEYEQRHEAVAAAQTYGQLAALVADLPSGPMTAPPTVAAPVPATFMAVPPPPQARPTSALAVISLLCSVLLLSAPAVITGHIARGEIRRRNMDGDWAAVFGLVLGYLGCTFWTLLLFFIAA
ncbi:DUF1707 and DUF4190 domain-containing protein [Streptomyces sp. CBMA156]|uniref:DUF1707 and DUF4190 domain-containing protein n=1 Tax=Streptomyces sp. CBMA156 TaxID=1930280 RepID=UPI001CB85E42|nr:DUF1707 domain-containing protein [Streptomyces sp. CBMA156]